MFPCLPDNCMCEAMTFDANSPSVKSDLLLTPLLAATGI